MKTPDLSECVVWRTGTPEAPVWHRSGPLTKDAAQAEVFRQIGLGNRAFRQSYIRLMTVGLPEGWEYVKGSPR